jgi:microcystin-dependent protein
MAEPFLGEVRIFSFQFAPRGWASCAGQLLAIQQNQALFAILGTTYGGDGVRTFALPDLRGRVPIHFGNGFVEGQSGGEEVHTLSLPELPSHSHFANALAAPGNSTSPAGNWLAESSRFVLYSATLSTPTTLQGGTVGSAGGSQPHENRQPYLTVNFCIALLGIFPSRN